jgi:predicted nucleic acid-binding protein
MRVLLDTNVVLDVLLRREPWREAAEALWQANDDGRLVGYVTATTLADVFYVARRLTDLQRARQAVQVCLDAFEIASVDRSRLERAQQLSGSDFEDNVQIACAEADGLDAIVTRDTDSFAGSTVAVWSPAECRRQLQGPA